MGFWWLLLHWLHLPLLLRCACAHVLVPIAICQFLPRSTYPNWSPLSLSFHHPGKSRLSLSYLLHLSPPSCECTPSGPFLLVDNSAELARIISACSTPFRFACAPGCTAPGLLPSFSTCLPSVSISYTFAPCCFFVTPVFSLLCVCSCSLFCP